MFNQPTLLKLKAEWKTFVLAITTTVVSAWQFAVDQGADIPSLLSWVDDKYKSAVYFGVGLLFLLLRNYKPLDIPAPAAPAAPEPPAEPELK